MPKPISAVIEGQRKIFSGCLIQLCSRKAQIATAIAAISGSTISRSPKNSAVATIAVMKANAPK